MAKIAIADEQAAREVIRGYIAAFALAGNVFPRRRSFNSRADFFKGLGTEVNNETEIRFVEMELVNIEDSPDEGPDDCPVATLTYNLHIFHQFADDRSDDTNSDTDFTDLLFRLRTFFLDEREFLVNGAWTVQMQPLVPAELTQFGNDTFTDCVGHFKDATLKVEFYDYAI